MSLGGRLFSKLLRLPKPLTRKVRIERDLRVPMPDGVDLLANRWVPEGGDDLPLVLVRSPYGRSGLFALLAARPFAERGFQVLIQSCRGTFGSGGAFDPVHHERDDGLATVEWLREQPWFPGQFGTFGPSYLGFVQWAIADAASPELRAIAPQVTASTLSAALYGGNSFGLDLALSWMNYTSKMEKAYGTFELIRGAVLPGDPLAKHWARLPLTTLDESLTKARVPFFQDWLQYETLEDPFWEKVRLHEQLARIDVPATMTVGWHDIFTPYQLRDFHTLQEAGRSPRVMIGPWQHSDFAVIGAGINDALALFRAEMHGDRSGLREKPVRLYVQGAKEWRDYDTWPPPGMRPEKRYLAAGGVLATEAPTEAGVDEYRFDPKDPTPAIGGPALQHKKFSVDNRKLEARPDVLRYTGEALAADTEVIGPVSAELFVESDRVHTDFFVRICDVHPDGRSMNVCDGLIRLRAGTPGELRRIDVEIWPTAYRFPKGHRIRVQISSGAHPRYVRNAGTGEPMGQATELLPAQQKILRGPDHPSSVTLPFIDSRPG